MRLCVENSRITLGSGTPVRYTNSLFVCAILAILGFANRHSYIDRRVAGTLRRQSARIGREYVPDFHVQPENVAGEAARSRAGSLIEARA